MKEIFKNTITKRILALVFALVLVASAATFALAADEEGTKGVEKGTYDTNYTVTTVKSVKSGSAVVGAGLQILDSKNAVVEEWTTTKDDYVIKSSQNTPMPR